MRNISQLVSDEVKTLISFISFGPIISWMYPVFGIQGAIWFPGVTEWLCAVARNGEPVLPEIVTAH